MSLEWAPVGSGLGIFNHTPMEDGSGSEEDNPASVVVLSACTSVFYAFVAVYALRNFCRAYSLYRSSTDDQQGLTNSEAAAAAYQHSVVGNPPPPPPPGLPSSPVTAGPGKDGLLVCHTYNGPRAQSPPAVSVGAPEDAPAAGPAGTPRVRRDSCDGDAVAVLLNSTKPRSFNGSFGARSDASGLSRSSAGFANTGNSRSTGGHAPGSTNAQYYSGSMTKNLASVADAMRRREGRQGHYGTETRSHGATTADPRETYYDSTTTAPQGCMEKLSTLLSNLLPFYAVCVAFAISRSVMWAMSAKSAVLVKEKVQLTFFILPSLMYLMMLSLLMTSWWSVFTAVSAFHTHHDFEHIRLPTLMYAGYGLQIAIFGFFIYCITSSSTMTDQHQKESTYAMVFAFFMMGCIMTYVGYRMRRTLNQLPYSFRGLDELKQRVRQISVVVGVSLFLRSFFSLIQMIHITHRFDDLLSGRYFVFVYYCSFEVIPLVVILWSLGRNRKEEAMEAEKPGPPAPPAPPPSKRVMSIPRDDHLRRTMSNSSPALNLNLTGCKRSLALHTPPSQDIEAGPSFDRGLRGVHANTTGALSPPFGKKHLQQQYLSTGRQSGPGAP